MSEVRTLRIPDELWAWLQADADRYGRTVAQSVRFYLTAMMRGDRAEHVLRENGTESEFAAVLQQMRVIRNNEPLQAWEKGAGS